VVGQGGKGTAGLLDSIGFEHFGRLQLMLYEILQEAWVESVGGLAQTSLHEQHARLHICLDFQVSHLPPGL